MYFVLFRCDFCKENDKERCYHWEAGDEASLEIFRQKLEEHLTLYVSQNGTHYTDIRRKTKIVYDPTDTLRTSNPYNVEYRPQGDTAATLAEAQRFFSNLVTTELRLRRLHLYGNMEERRIRLEKLLIVEQKIDLISQAVLRGDEGKEAAMLLISQAIPCILHLENRVGEKLVTVLLAMAANKYQERSNCRTLTRFANIIQDIFNTRILGSFTRPSQWKLLAR